ncbi:hypothetical protein DV532_28110 (plasmid) [Pseudomonas sp. Leaf58]|uniref:hypothetical protein n=1 Tax=Pseudomonas sp. Leaf58 TaxID=1736226 RepID=UPI000701892F|nr:hypothetical protein [Pseudomonas sp. Leaf58]AYG48134.1 hypothetical protein DV532_28110 [Pseudomonas sp. Leaf58]KQN62312.1 hypothetical protein ASF02_09110 [Pseudomonas sp. Leaf58]
MKPLRPIDLILIMQRSLQEFGNWAHEWEDLEKTSSTLVASYMGQNRGDTGCALIARLAGFDEIPVDLTINDLRGQLAKVLGSEGTALRSPPQELEALITLGEKPGGWKHLDQFWELLSQTSLTYACTAEPKFNPLLDPGDRSSSFRYTLEAAHYSSIDTQDDDGNEIYICTVFDHFRVTNSLESMLQAIPEILEECNKLKFANSGFWHRFEIFDGGKRLVGVPLNYDITPDYGDAVPVRTELERYNFLPAELIVSRPSRGLVGTLIKVYGTDVVGKLLDYRPDERLGWLPDYS